ncbi:MAG: non-homologous end-joining DNA ligase [Bacilli bacterium]
MNKLKEYNQKRNFDKTKEPFGKEEKYKRKKYRYVIQHHQARKDHYDLRLEWQGVFISFAVPKGPSFDPKDKRLAIKVEDHPLNYGNFEGTIPKGEYGGGTVMLWDKGYWEPITKPDFKNNSMKFIINGIRIKGAYSLVKFKENNWLLIKEKDEYVCNIDISKYKTSIKTNRTMDEISGKKTNIHLDDIEITSPEKVIIPKGKITKGEIIDYYKLVAKRMMPYLENRLISTIRCPNGLTDEVFFMKHLNTDSNNIGKKRIKDKNNNYKDYYYIKNIMGLIEETQMNSYEFHIWGCLQNNINKPDILVFDFDPDNELSLKKLRNGVKDLKKVLDKLRLKSYLKTSGGKGYHILVPLKTNSWKKTENIAENISRLMVENNPKLYTINMRKEKRSGKIFIDYFRNKKGATSVCPYSIRLRDNAPVSMPISWNNIDKIKPNSVTIKNIKEYLKKRNPWQDFFK